MEALYTKNSTTSTCKHSTCN